MDELIRRLVMHDFTVTFSPTLTQRTSGKVLCNITRPLEGLAGTSVNVAGGLAETTEQAFNDALIEIVVRDWNNLR